MSSDLELLSSAFKSIFGVSVVARDDIPPPHTREGSVEDLLKETFVMQEAADLNPDSHVSVKSITGTNFNVKVELSTCTGAQLMYLIQEQEGFAVQMQKVICRGRLLQNGTTLSKQGIADGELLHLVLKIHQPPMPRLTPGEFHPEFNVDFTSVEDDGATHYRGGFEYKRPYGWKRFAIKVAGKYESDEWLGNNSGKNEWPVTYYATKFTSNRLQETIMPGNCRALFGSGIYTSPDLEMVDKYFADKFTHRGKCYKLVLQTRVNPDVAKGHLKVIPASLTGLGGDFWVSPKHFIDWRDKNVHDNNVHDVRPYGILIKEVEAPHELLLRMLMYSLVNQHSC